MKIFLWKPIPNIFLVCKVSIFKRFFKIYLFLGRGERREKERERNINVWLPFTHPYWRPSPQPSTCPDWESNQRPFGSQAGSQSAEPPSQGSYWVLWLLGRSSVCGHHHPVTACARVLFSLSRALVFRSVSTGVPGDGLRCLVVSCETRRKTRWAEG